MTTPETQPAASGSSVLDAFLKPFGTVQERVPESLRLLKTAARDQFARVGFPSRRDEEWRFTSVSPILRHGYSWLPESQPENELPDRSQVDSLVYDGCCPLVFLNGRYQPHLSGAPPEGIEVRSLSQALKGEASSQALEQLGKHADSRRNSFVHLNTALFDEGAFIRVPRGQVIETPIQLLFLGSGSAENAPLCYPRVLLVAEESSQASVIESFVGLTDESVSYFTCPVTEIICRENSVVEHYKVQKESLGARHVATQQVYMERAANFSSHSIQHGGALVRTDTNAVLDGEGIECILNGIYVIGGKQHVDNHMRVEHVAPNCYSHELYKGILDGKSRAVFNGRIFVHKGAQKTDAVQTNRNLILSDEAMVNSNPQLEIFADDVKCTHGSTTGHLDPEAVFYLRSRGIEEEAAKSLLTYAFASEFVDEIKNEALSRDLNEFLFARLAGGDIVRQAI